MTEKQLKKTQWAKEFKSQCPGSYEQAILLALDKYLSVQINKNDDNGEMLWAIETYNGFWMDAKKTKKEAIALCKKMKWKIRWIK